MGCKLHAYSDHLKMMATPRLGESTAGGKVVKCYLNCLVEQHYIKSNTFTFSEPLVHEIAPHHITATPQETGLTVPLNERHIPLYAQEPSLLSRQGHSQQTYTSRMTTYQYLNLSVIPIQDCPKPHMASTPGQIPYLHQTQQQLPPAIKRQCTE